MSRLEWRGRNVERAVSAAVRRGVDDTTAATAIEAKQTHPGWRNRTGTAEGSIRMEPAVDMGRTVRGRVGSFTVDYFIWLELKHGSALRRAADAIFPTLPLRIRGNLR